VLSVGHGGRGAFHVAGGVESEFDAVHMVREMAGMGFWTSSLILYWVAHLIGN